MFLFTTPTSTAPPSGVVGPAAPTGSNPVVSAIRQGAQATGTDFDYLLRTAKRESALDPSAKAPTSSATGLFQFIEQTWLGVIKSDGDKIGLADEAKAVTTKSDGTLTVADPEARQAILRLREQPEVASVMAGALTRQNREALTAATGRDPSAGELYMAHVLGARGAADLISTAQSDPARAAATDFPAAARANRSIFFDKTGRARGAGEVYGVLAAAQTGTATAPAATSAVPATVPDTRPPGIYGLFQTGARTSPVSDAVARIWRGQGVAPRTASVGASFFPRSDGMAETPADASGSATVQLAAAATTPAAIPTGTAADVPLPPARPRFLDIRPALVARQRSLTP